MNTNVLLTEQQETNRAVEAYDIYNQGLVEKVNSREYIVKGKYIVEDLTTNEDIEPFYRCSCPDNQYRHVLCKHISSVQFLLLDIGA